MSDKVFVGQRTAKLNIGEKPDQITRVNLIIDSDHMYTAGNDTGRTIEKNCAWGTQAMCDSILSQVSRISYQPFSCESALIDPAAETGDGITVGGIYSVLADSTIKFNGLYSAAAAAPGGDEVEDEYPYKSRSSRQNSRELAKIRSSITKTAKSITLLVENEIDGLSGRLELTAESLTTEIKNTQEDLSSKIEQTATSITTQINATNGQVSSIKQYVDNITLEVTNGSTSSSIALKSGSVTISSKNITMSGLVTYTGLSSGTTTIDGACIKTGIIDANRINLTGAITFSDFNYGLQQDLNDTANTAYNANAAASDAINLAGNAMSAASNANNTVSGWTYSGTTYIDGGKIMSGTVMASRLLGGMVGLLDHSQSMIGGIEIAYTSTGYGVSLLSYTGGIRINPAGNFWVDAYGGSFGLTSSGVVCGANCLPQTSGRYSCGGSGLLWTDVWAANGTIITSDRKKKTDISYSLEKYDAFFDRLRPASYKFTDGTSGRRHVGMIAQDVEEALRACGIPAEEFAGIVKSPRLDEDGEKIDGEYDYALRYSEFIAMCIARLQRLTEKVAALERRFAA